MIHFLFMRRYHSLLEKPPRPEYERNFGHELEDVVEKFINDKLPGLSCIHASEQEDLSNGKDIVVSIAGTDLEKPFQVTMTTNPDRLAAKESRGVPLIVIPKKEVEEAWREFSKAKKEEPNLTFSYQFLPPKAQEAIMRGLIREPAIKRHLLRVAQEKRDGAVTYP